MESQTAPIESKMHRRIAAGLALAISIGFFAMIMGYWSPGADGGDRNGYLLEGKLFASGRASMTPANEFVFLGTHWVETKPGVYCLKYPPGLPAIYGLVYLVLGVTRGSYWANLVSPLFASLAVWGTFLILREIISSFYALLGMIVLAVSPVTVIFAMMPNSHAASLCAVVWGMFCVLKWYREETIWLGIAGGLILGFAATIRYTEATLVLPLIVAICYSGQTVVRRFLPLAAWCIPLIAVAMFNFATIGGLTGYGLTNESTAFSLEYLLKNAPTMLLQLNMVALILIFPISIIGMILLVREKRDLGTMVLAWVLPTVLAYTAYYWAPQGYIVAYMRFILPAMPGMVLAAMWALHRWMSGRRGEIYAGVIVALAAIASMHAATVMGEDLKRHNGACVIAGDHVAAHVAPHSTVLSEQRLLPHLETIGNFDIYLFCGLTQRYLSALSQGDADAPQAMQPERMQWIADFARDHSDKEMAQIQRQMIQERLERGLHVYLALDSSDMAYFRQQFLTPTTLKMKVIDVWCEPANLMGPQDTPAPATDARPAMTSPEAYRTMEIVELLR